MVHVADKTWKYDPNRSNVGVDGNYEGPVFAKMLSMPPRTGELLAWDPIAQKPVWRAKHAVADGGGVLATGGNLVFQGRADGILAAFRATDGEPLWQFDAGTGIMAPPVTYTADGVQYVTVMAGWGGAAGLMNIPASGAPKPGWGRILTFALNGTATLKTPPYGHKDPPVLPAITTNLNPQTVHQGGVLFSDHCFLCHGLNAVAGPCPISAMRAKRHSIRSNRSCSKERAHPTGCLRSKRSSLQKMWSPSGRISSRVSKRLQDRCQHRNHGSRAAAFSLQSVK